MVGKRGNRWWARAYVGRQQKWLGTFATRKEAVEAERMELRKRPVKGRETCDSFAARWIADYPRQGGATRRTYRYALKPFVTEFKGVPLTDVDRPSARAWALRYRDNARVVRTMFSDALRDGLVADNPFTGLRLEQPRGRRDITALTTKDVDRLAQISMEVHFDYGPQFAALILFAADTGLRPAELFVLERDDLDMDEVHVKRSLSATGEIKLPKNGQPRIVTIPPRARQALVAVAPRLDTPLLFTTPRGKRLSKSSLYYYWRPVVSKFGRHLDWYELRHYCATQLLELGVSHADVAVQLGHTDGGRLVMERYGHPSETAARERLKAAFRSVTPLRVANESQREADSA